MSKLALWRHRCCVVGAASWLVCGAVMAAQPAAGRYVARWCVAVAYAEPSCSPVEVQWRTGGLASVRISDIVYALRLRTSRVDVTLKQGTMQIDGFSAIYEWDSTTLRFADADKSVRYELQTLVPRSRRGMSSPSTGP